MDWLHVNDVTFTGNPLMFANIVQEYAARLREIRAEILVQEVMAEVPMSDPIAFAREVERRARALTPTVGSSNLRDILKQLGDKFDRQDKESLTGITTGYACLDRVTWGLQPKTLYLVAGRPSMGKSAFLANIAANAARAGGRVYIQALEESSQSVATRMLSRKSRVSNENIRRGQVAERDWDRVYAGMNELAELDIVMDETAGLDSEQICARVRKADAKKKVSLVIVDHFQQIREDEPNRHLEMSRAAQNFKDLSKYLDIPVVGVSQLSREVERETDKRPQLKHLKESGDLEAIADVIMMLFRPSYYDKNLIQKDLVEVNIAKNRDGRTGNIEMKWNPEIMEFSETLFSNS